MSDTETKTETPVETDEKETLLVTDTNVSQRFPKRTHAMIVGGVERGYTFEWDKGPLRMPVAEAHKFLIDEAFVVENDEGKRVPPLTLKRDSNVLAEDEVVATLSELTVEALLKRAHAQVGGEDLRKQNGKPKIVEFLIEKQRAKIEAAGSGTVDGIRGTDSGDVMNDAELNHMFEDAA